MYRAMALKELRQTRRLALLGLVAYALMVASLISSDSLNPYAWLLSVRSNSLAIPFVDYQFPTHFCWIAAALAILLGLAQTLGESMHGTYLLLFHRPATQRWLIGMKLAVGLTVYLVCGAIPIFVYGLWAATPGNHASPFAWSMTVLSWTAWFGITVLYLGAFLSGIRSGRWSRSRLLPLVAAVAIAFFAFMLWAVDNVGVLWLLLVFVIADSWMIAMIFFVARSRDYS